MLKTRSRTVMAGGSNSVTVGLKMANYTWRDYPPFLVPYRNAPDFPPYALAGSITYNEPHYVALYEKIRSDDDPTIRDAWKPCQHYKRWLESPIAASCPLTLREMGYTKYYISTHGVPLWWGAANSTSFISNLGMYGAHTYGMPDMFTAEHPVTGDFVSPPTGIGALCDGGYAAMLPRIKSEMSLINSVLELSDFKTLPATLVKVQKLAEAIRMLPKSFRAAKSRYRKFRKSFSSTYGMTLDESTRVASDVHLQVQFGILPLLRDISGYSAALVRTHKAVNDLVNKQGKVQRRHFTCPLVLPRTNYVRTAQAAYNMGTFVSPAGTVLPSGGTYQTAVFNRPENTFTVTRMSTETSVFHMQLEYTYKFLEYELRNAEVLGFLDALGVQLNPTIIWNAIPWTFVVDWLLDVSRWLNKYTVLNLKPVVNIRRALWSCKTERVTYLHLGGGYSIPYSPDYKFSATPLHTLHETTYRRSLGAMTDSSFVMSGLTNKQWVLAAALANTRKWRPKWTV